MFAPDIFWEIRMGTTEVPSLCVQPLCAWGLSGTTLGCLQTWLTGQFSNEMEIWLGKTSIYTAFSIAMFDYPEGSSWFVDGGQRKTEKIRSSAFTNAFAAAQVKVSPRSVAQIFESHPSILQMAQIQTKQEYSLYLIYLNISILEWPVPKPSNLPVFTHHFLCKVQGRADFATSGRPGSAWKFGSRISIATRQIRTAWCCGWERGGAAFLGSKKAETIGFQS